MTGSFAASIGKVNIVLNLKDVSEIDSTGLGTLVLASPGLRKRRKTGARKPQPVAPEIVSADQAGRNASGC